MQAATRSGSGSGQRQRREAQQGVVGRRPQPARRPSARRRSAGRARRPRGRTGIGRPRSSIELALPRRRPRPRRRRRRDRRRRRRPRRPSRRATSRVERRRASSGSSSALGPGQFSRWPLRRGQRWPCGSSGWPHSGHGGRPAASTRSARPTNARAASGVIRTRSRSGPSSVVVVERLGSSLLLLVRLGDLPGLEQHEVVRVSQPSDSVPARNASLIGSSSGAGSASNASSVLGALDPAPLQLVEQVVEALGRGRRPGPSRGRPRRSASRRGPGGRRCGCRVRRRCRRRSGQGCRRGSGVESSWRERTGWRGRSARPRTDRSGGSRGRRRAPAA